MDNETDYTSFIWKRYRRPSASSLTSANLPALRFLFERDFPFPIQLDFNRYFADLKESGYVGPVFDVLEEWCRKSVRGEWQYLSRTPHGKGVMYFTRDDDAAGFVERFGGERIALAEPDYRGSRRVDGIGRHPVPLGWHQSSDRHSPLDRTNGIKKAAEEWCTANVTSGFWHIGMIGYALPGGYELGDTYAQFAVYFTDEEDAESFRAHLAASPLGVPPDDGRSVDVGMVAWPEGYSSSLEVAGIFPDERKWCVENSGWFNWKVLTTSEVSENHRGPRSYRTYFRFPRPEVAAAFREWRSTPDLCRRSLRVGLILA